MDSTLDSFTDVIRCHQAGVFAVAYGVTGDRGLSEDVTQETFVVAWRDRASLRDEAKLPQWLRGIARNLALNARGKAGPVAEVRGEIASADPRDEAVADEEARMTWDALRELPESYREALILYYWEDRSARDVATALEISEAAVQQRLSRGRALLREEVLRRVEGALRRGRPGAALTAAIIAAIAAGATSTAQAAPVAATTPTKVTAAPVRFARHILLGAGALVLAIAVAVVLAIGGRSSDEQRVAARTSTESSLVARTPAEAGSGNRSLATGATSAITSTSTSAAADGEPSEDLAGMYYVIRIDGWGMLPRELYTATERCFVPELVGAPAALKITVKDRSIASADVSPTAAAWPERIMLLGDDRKPLTQADARTRIAEKKDLITARGWAKAGGPGFSPPDDGLPVSEFLTACVTANLVGQRVDVQDGVQTVTLTGEKVVPKKPDRAGYADLDVAHGATRGPNDAKVTIVAFVGLEDRFSKAAIKSLDEVLAKYPRDVRVVVKPVTLRPDGENLAGEAVLAANAQGALWPMLERVSGQHAPTLEQLVAIAGELGLDAARVRTKLTQHAYRDELQLLQDQRTTMEVTALPSCLVNGKRVHGAVGTDTFVMAVEEALAL